MNTAKQTIGLLLTLLILSIAGWYYTHLETGIKLDKETLSTTVDATVTGLTVRQFDQNGFLANLFITPLMHHVPKKNIYLFKTPHITIAQKDQPSWEISSKKAKSFHGGQKIVFSRNVVVHQNQGDKTQESTLKTEKVIYYPKEKKASTNLLVTFEQPGNKVQSTGMNAYLDEKRVELLHKAKGIYVPAKG